MYVSIIQISPEQDVSELELFNLRNNFFSQYDVTN